MPYVGASPYQLSLSGLGAATKAKAKTQAHAAAHQAAKAAKTAKQLQLQTVRIQNHLVKVHPKDAPTGAPHLEAVMNALHQTHASLKQAVSQVRTPAQARALIPVLASHRSLLGQNLPSAAQASATKSATRAVKGSRLRGLGALAWNVAGLLGLHGLSDDIADSIANDPTLSIDPNDPNNTGGGGYYASGAPVYTGGGYSGPSYGVPPLAPSYSPATGVDPTTGVPYSQEGGTGINSSSSLMSMLPLLMGQGGFGGGTGGVGCTNPNLPRCIIANMAEQSQQNLLFIFMIIMQMFQETTQNMSTLQSQALYGQQQYPYGGYPGYGGGYAPQYGGAPGYDPTTGLPYGQQPQYGYGMPQYPVPGYSMDSQQIPPGYDSGSSGGDVFTGAPAPSASPITNAVPQLNVAPDGSLTPTPQMAQTIIQPSGGSGGSSFLPGPGMTQSVAIAPPLGSGEGNSGDSWDDGSGGGGQDWV